MAEPLFDPGRAALEPDPAGDLLAVDRVAAVGLRLERLLAGFLEGVRLDVVFALVARAAAARAGAFGARLADPLEPAPLRRFGLLEDRRLLELLEVGERSAMTVSLACGLCRLHRLISVVVSHAHRGSPGRRVSAPSTTSTGDLR
ncbi:MAG: hypothetical protein JO039_00615 [Solirubrobacterales bacterium]|nr:hypothetical protein [Solirubrobacterales bacterium]